MKARQEVAAFVLSGTTGSRPFTSRPGARQGGRRYAQDRALWAHRSDWHNNLVCTAGAQRGWLTAGRVHPLRRPCADPNAHADARTDNGGPDANAIGSDAGPARPARIWRTGASRAPTGNESAGTDARVGGAATRRAATQGAFAGA